MANRRCIGISLFIMAITFGLDQWSKSVLLKLMLMPPQPPIEVLPFFNLVMVWNTGISFGLMSGHNPPYVFIGLSAVILTLLAVWLKRTSSIFIAGALGLIIGGALGNIADRVQYGAVADFFDFYIGSYHWPAFNIADSAIFIGVVLLCIHSIFIEQKTRKNP